MKVDLDKLREFCTYPPTDKTGTLIMLLTHLQFCKLSSESTRLKDWIKVHLKHMVKTEALLIIINCAKAREGIITS